MRGRELPAGFPARHDVFKMFVKEYLKDWEEPTFAAIEDTGNILDEVFSIVVEHHVPRTQLPELHHAIAEALSAILQSRLEVAIKSSGGVQALFEDESEPMALNINHYFMDTYNKIKMDKLEQAIQKADSTSITPESALNYMRNWYSRNHMIGNASNEEQECENLQAMLTAYWKTSSKRFVDNVCLRVDTLMLRDLGRELFNSPAVAKQLMGSDEAVQSLFAEDAKVRDKRRHLMQRKSVLEEALKILVQHVVSASNA